MDAGAATGADAVGVGFTGAAAGADAVGVGFTGAAAGADAVGVGFMGAAAGALMGARGDTGGILVGNAEGVTSFGCCQYKN
jgi:hypothetical protein